MDRLRLEFRRHGYLPAKSQNPRNSSPTAFLPEIAGFAGALPRILSYLTAGTLQLYSQPVPESVESAKFPVGTGITKQEQTDFVTSSGWPVNREPRDRLAADLLFASREPSRGRRRPSDHSDPAALSIVWRAAWGLLFQHVDFDRQASATKQRPSLVSSQPDAQNRLLLCLVPPMSHAGMDLVPRFDRARNLMPGLSPSVLGCLT